MCREGPYGVALPLVPREDQPHEWISFEDPDEMRTWMLDATFLRSSYKCIYGQGCQGILDDASPELMHGCCSFGAHFLDEKDFKNVTKYVKRLKGRHWKNKDKAKDKGWFSTEKDGEKRHVLSTVLASFITLRASKVALVVHFTSQLLKQANVIWTGSQTFVGKCLFA